MGRVRRACRAVRERLNLSPETARLPPAILVNMMTAALYFPNPSMYLNGSCDNIMCQ